MCLSRLKLGPVLEVIGIKLGPPRKGVRVGFLCGRKADAELLVAPVWIAPELDLPTSFLEAANPGGMAELFVRRGSNRFEIIDSN